MKTMTRPTLESLSACVRYWEKTGDLLDQCIDLMLNLRQSGHPGGSRSKVPALVALTLGGAMRWDIRRPELAFGDRFVLIAGHCAPLVYAMLAVYNEALALRHAETGDPRYLVPNAAERQLRWTDLLTFRHNKSLAGHAEMEGKTLFFKFNTGPSGHGGPAAFGEAVALKHAGATGVKVFGIEGEGGLTAGAHHEVKNSAYGLGLDNLVYLVDWNDYGIDVTANSAVVAGTPVDWFAPYGWRVAGTEHGEDYLAIARAIHEIAGAEDAGGRPGCVWFKTRKGRGYYKYDAPSHGSPHARNSELFWKCRADFQEKYGVEFPGFGRTEDPGEDACRKTTRSWFETVLGVMRDDPDYYRWLADTLVELGESVPAEVAGFRLGARDNLARDRAWLAVDKLPAELFVKPGAKAPNRQGFATFGAWANALAKKRMGRPLFLACSADLADSTNISGFAKSWGDFPGFGWYDRNGNTQGCLLPQRITEFANAGLCVGAATVNFATAPEEEFLGYWTACSTYGSFSYLKYGMMRLFSQLAQDCELKVGKVIWVAGHSGPETAEDSRTHFGVFAPAVTELFPDGQVINLHPWEHNEVAPMLAAALSTEAPIVALHLTRPLVLIPDRAALGVPSHLEAAKGAYVIKPHDPKRPREGTLIVHGTAATESLYALLPRLRAGEGPNVKLVQATSWQLFRRQPASWRDAVLPRADWLDSTVLTNGSRRQMLDWMPNDVAREYAMSSDWDDRWRTGGSVAELKVEARIDPDSIWAGLARFAADRPARLRRIAIPG
ncbi:MAG: transketolase [Planctomycetota bacterium]